MLSLREVLSKLVGLKPVLKKPLQEVHTQDYHFIEQAGHTNNVYKVDIYAPHSAIFDRFNVVLVQYEKCFVPSFLRAAFDRA